jgi:hypothetical protein
LSFNSLDRNGLKKGIAAGGFETWNSWTLHKGPVCAVTTVQLLNKVLGLGSARCFSLQRSLSALVQSPGIDFSTIHLVIGFTLELTYGKRRKKVACG